MTILQIKGMMSERSKGGRILVNAYLVHAVWAVGGLDCGGELAARPDVPDDGLLDAGEELRAVLG